MTNDRSKTQEITLKSKLEIIWPKVKYQYKFKNCIFDFILFERSIIFEAKLNKNAFSREQYDKYTKALPSYNIIYLIGLDELGYIEDNVNYTMKTTKISSDIDEFKQQILFINKVIYELKQLI